MKTIEQILEYRRKWKRRKYAEDKEFREREKARQRELFKTSEEYREKQKEARKTRYWSDPKFR
jgi:hypothetical protein